MSIEQQLRELIDCSIEASIVKPGARVVLVEQIELAIMSAEAAPAGGEAVAWMTHHDEPMLFATEKEAASYCDDDEIPVPLYAAPGPQAVPGGKYDAVLKPFVALMERELHANSGKGDRPGWLAMDRKTCLLEIYYHLAKLQKAAKDNDGEGIREYAADVANMSMMLVDVSGLLLAAKAEG